MIRSMAILNLLFVLFTSVTFAQNKCVSSYLPIKYNVERVLNTNYAKSFLFSELEKNYSVKWVSDLGPILNQKNWGFCHLYGFFGEITREYKQRHNGQDPNVSIHYMAFHHWLGRAIETALTPGENLKPQEGGWYIYDIELFKKIGSMKMDEYLRLGGKTDVEERLNKFLEDSILTKTISDMHDQQNLLNEIFKSDFTDKELDVLTKDVSSSASHEAKLTRARTKYIQSLFEGNEYRRIDEFKQFVTNKEKAFAMKETALTKEQLQVLRNLADGKIQMAELTANKIKQIKNNLRQDVKQEMTRLFSSFFFGKVQPPKEVMNLEKNVQLAEELFPEIAQATISISVDEKALRFGNQLSAEDRPDLVKMHVYLKASLPTLYEIIADNVEQKNNGVWVGYDHNDPFVANKVGDANLGLMSLKAFAWSPSSPYLTRHTRFERKGIFNGGHAVQIVGIIREKLSPELEQAGEKGDIKAFIIQNSWGTEAGQNGFYVMDRSYADAFLFGITIRDESGELIQRKNEMRSKILESQKTHEADGFKTHIEKEKQLK